MRFTILLGGSLRTANRMPRKWNQSSKSGAGLCFFDKTGKSTVAMHWEHYFNHMVNRHNEIYKYQLPNITPNVCKHTYGSNMAVSGISSNTL